MSIFYSKVYSTLGRWRGRNSFIGKSGCAEVTDGLTNEYYGPFQLKTPPKDLIPPPYRLVRNTLLLRLQRRKQTYRCDQRILLAKHPRRIKKPPEPIKATKSNPPFPDQNKHQSEILPAPNNTGEIDPTNINLLTLLPLVLILPTHKMKESDCAARTKAKPRIDETDNKQNTREDPATPKTQNDNREWDARSGRLKRNVKKPPDKQDDTVKPKSSPKQLKLKFPKQASSTKDRTKIPPQGNNKTRGKGNQLPVAGPQKTDGVNVAPGTQDSGGNTPIRKSQTNIIYSPRRRKSGRGGRGGGKRIVEPSNSPKTRNTPETAAKRLELMRKRSKFPSTTPPSEPENTTEPIIESPPRTIRETVDLMSPTDEMNPANESNIHNRAKNRRKNNSQTKTTNPTTGENTKTKAQVICLSNVKPLQTIIILRRGNNNSIYMSKHSLEVKGFPDPITLRIDMSTDTWPGT